MLRNGVRFLRAGRVVRARTSMDALPAPRRIFFNDVFAFVAPRASGNVLWRLAPFPDQRFGRRPMPGSRDEQILSASGMRRYAKEMRMATNLSETVEIMTEPDGSVDVVIPSNRLWDCVECFGENRLSACYRF